MPNHITYTMDGNTVTLSQEEILQRLGAEASEQDAATFVRIWHTRFYDGGVPDFDGEEDRDNTWSEILQIMAGNFSRSATV